MRVAFLISPLVIASDASYGRLLGSHRCQQDLRSDEQPSQRVNPPLTRTVSFWYDPRTRFVLLLSSCRGNNM